MKIISFFAGLMVVAMNLPAQHHHQTAVGNVEPQPSLAQAQRVREALTFIGNALPADAIQQLQALEKNKLDHETTKKIQEILDQYCLALIEINPESRVKVMKGPVRPVLMQEGWTSFLLKINNQEHITASLVPESPECAARATRFHQRTPDETPKQT